MAWLTSHGLGVMGSIPVNASSLLDQTLGFKASEIEKFPQHYYVGSDCSIVVEYQT